MSGKKVKRVPAPGNLDGGQKGDSHKSGSLAESQIISFYEEKVRPNWRKVLWFVLLTILLMVVIFRFHRARQEARAAGYSRLDAAGTIEELRILADDYAGQEVAAMALLRKGRLLLQEEDDYQAAVTVFERVLAEFTEIRYQLPARSGKAYSLEAAGEAGQARAEFTAITNLSNIDKANLVAAWSGIGRNSLSLEQSDQAVEALNRVLELTEEGPYAEQARQLLRDIEIDAVIF